MAMNIVRAIFTKVTGEQVHAEFIKFSKGVFTNKYLIEAKKQKDAWSIKTGAEFANYFVRACLEKAAGMISVSGAIISTLDMRSEIEKAVPVAGIKQFMGVKQLQINTEVEPRKIIDLMDKFPRAFFALSFSTESTQLKIKPKAPKSSKPAAGREKDPAANFCSLKTRDKEIVNDILFDVPEFKEVRIWHTLSITDIILPKGVSNPVEMREKAVRKGVLTRTAIVDGKERKSEAVFEA